MTKNQEDLITIIKHFIPEPPMCVWEAGFLTGIEVATKAIIGENSLTTQTWVITKIKNFFKLNK
jgi:hypothetical protein